MTEIGTDSNRMYPVMDFLVMKIQNDRLITAKVATDDEYKTSVYCIENFVDEKISVRNLFMKNGQFHIVGTIENAISKLRHNIEIVGNESQCGFNYNPQNFTLRNLPYDYVCIYDYINAPTSQPQLWNTIHIPPEEDPDHYSNRKVLFEYDDLDLMPKFNRSWRNKSCCQN